MRAARTRPVASRRRPAALDTSRRPASRTRRPCRTSRRSARSTRPADGGEDQQGIHRHAPRDRGRGAGHQGREDVILEEMEKAEGLAAGVKGEETDFKVVEAEAKKAQVELDAHGPAAGERRAPARGARCGSCLDPEDVRELYARVAKQRGSGVAEAREGMCQACHVRMRSRSGSRSRKNEQLFQCESCSRIYFYEPPRHGRRRALKAPAALRLHVDGASRGNPGEAGFGIHVTAPTAARSPRSSATSKGHQQRGRVSGPAPRLRFALARGAMSVEVFSTRAAGEAARGATASRTPASCPCTARRRVSSPASPRRGSPTCRARGTATRRAREPPVTSGASNL